MFEFLFKYPTTVFAKGEFVLLARWPVWVLALAIVAACALFGFLLWRRRGRMAAGLTGWRPAAIWVLQSLLAALLLVIRPISVAVGLFGSKTSASQRGMVGWFGIRGIGSLYYLMYAIQHGLPEALSLQLIQMTLIVVTLSILLHGTSVKPLMGLFWKRGK